MVIKKNKISLPGSALYIAVIISLIAAVLSVLFILSRYYGYIHINRFDQQISTSDLVSSCINRVMQEPDVIPFDTFTELSIDPEDEQQCRIRKRHWGVFNIVEASASWKHIAISKIALYGKRFLSDKQPGLYLADHGHYLVVAGDSYISGQCFLPILGVRKGYIDGKSFKYESTVDGSIRESKEELPPISTELIDYLNKKIFTQYSSADSLVGKSFLNSSPKEHSFSKRTIRILDRNELNLSGEKLDGNFIVQSDKRIFISSNNEFNNVLFIAPIIEIEENFTGCIQVLAMDTVILNKNVQLKYPSAVVAAGFGRSSNYIEIASGVRIAGALLQFAEILDNQNVHLRFAEGAEVYGEVYCSGKVELKGKVMGSLYCDRFVLQTRQGYYENHLLDAWIHPRGLDQSFTGGLILDKDNSLNRVVEWLN